MVRSNQLSALNFHPKSAGMALVSVLIFSVVAMIVITAAMSLSVATAQSNQQFMQGQVALNNAESGADNALIQLLRNPNYSGETLTLPEGTATILASGSNPKVINVTGVAGTSVRKLQITATTTLGVIRIVSWQEVY
jgi:hypothetical protein